MDNTISCAVTKDLLPNYIEKLTSEETNKVIEAHLQSCSECMNERNAMLSYVDTEKAPENKKMKNYLIKTKIMYLLKGIGMSLGIIGIVVCLIVDIAINRRLTWSIIVDAGVIYLYVCALPAILSKKHKVIKIMAAASILVLPLLYIIKSVINKNYVNKPLSWFGEIALPISLIWIGILWITILIRYLMKLNIWNTIGIFTLLAIIGNALTNSIAGHVTLKDVYITDMEWIDSIVYLVSSIICFIIGYRRKRK